MWPGSRPRAGSSKPPASSAAAHAARQLQQGERVAAGLGDDAVADALVEPARDRPRQQRPRVLVVQARERQLRQAVELVLGCPARARRTRSPPTRPAAAGRRSRAPGRGAVEPLRVVDEAEQRPLLGDRGQQAEHRQRDQEAVGRVAGRAAPARRSARRAAAPGARRAGRASARRAGAGRRTAAPSRPRRRRSARPGSRPPGGRSNAAARSCRRPPRRGRRAPRSGPARTFSSSRSSAWRSRPGPTTPAGGGRPSGQA